jgi:hypothetical protein
MLMSYRVYSLTSNLFESQTFQSLTVFKKKSANVYAIKLVLLDSQWNIFSSYSYLVSQILLYFYVITVKFEIGWFHKKVGSPLWTEEVFTH